MTIEDFQGQMIRLTARQWNHAVGHGPYMVGMQKAVQETLEDPHEVRKSSKDPDTVRLYYKRYTDTPVGDKLMCVVAKFLENDAFILTAYLTDKFKPGELIWRIE